MASGNSLSSSTVKSLHLTLRQGEITGQTFTSRLFACCFVHTAQALFSSTPQLLARNRRAVAQDAQLGPGDLICGVGPAQGVDSAAEDCIYSVLWEA